MKLHSIRRHIPEVNSWLLAGICFLLPTQVAPIYILSALLLIFSLLQTDFWGRFKNVIGSTVNWAFVAYYFVFLVSMLWTADVEWGWHIVGRQIPFLLFPLFWSAANENSYRRCISAFIAGITLCVILAHYNWLQMHIFTAWPEGIRVNKSPEDTAPFVDRIMYAPMLALGAYFVGYRLFFERKSALAWTAYLFLFVAIITNLLLSGGRAGLVGFCALLITLIVQRLSRHPIKAVLLAFATVAVILGAGYSTSSYLRERVDSAVIQAMHPTQNINSSVGLRINFLVNTSRLFMENPWIGVGAGDFPSEYERINKQYSPQAITTVNPHNQIMLVLSSTGLLGAISLICLLVTTLLPALRSSGETKHHMIAVWVGYMAICMFESYFWRSNTALAFCVLMALMMKELSSPTGFSVDKNKRTS